MQHIKPDAAGVWQTLFSKALVLIHDVETRTGASLFWTFGGGTVLMLRHNHRQSKDIDIFVPDPQSLVVRFIKTVTNKTDGFFRLARREEAA